MSSCCMQMHLMETLFSSSVSYDIFMRYFIVNERICEREKEEESKCTEEGGVGRAGRERGKEEGMNVWIDNNSENLE